MIRKLRLQTILILSLAVLLTSTVASIGVLSYRTFAEAIIDQRADSRTDVLHQVSTRMSEVQRVMVTLSNLCFQTPYLTEILLKTETPQDDVAGEQARLDVMCKVLGDSSGFSLWYEFSMADGYTYSSDVSSQPLAYEEYARQLWFLDLDKQGREISWTGQSVEGGGFVISVARLVIDPETGEPSGLCMVRLAEAVLADTYIATAQGDSDSSIYMVDNKGRVVSHSNPYMLGFNYFNMNNFYRIFQDQEYAIIDKSGVSYLFSYYQNPDTGWVVVEEIPLEEILAPLQSLRVTIMAVSIAILCASVLLAVVLASMTTKPLKRLFRQFEQVGTGASVKFSVAGWKEISTICDECNIMMERIENLLLAVKTREREKRKAEISMLQLQVHPHFLYNTLFSIRCLMEMRDYERALPMMTSFISLLHGMLDTESEKVTLADEMELLEQYVYIQRYRFGDKFTFHVDCPAELRQHRILRLLLQPLVENAILHGMKDLPRPGIIRLEVRRSGNDLVLRLMDNGCGMEEEFAEELAKRPPTPDHVGLGNVASRLSAHYGRGYGLCIHSAPDCGTSIVICVPLKEEEGNGKWLKS